MAERGCDHGDGKISAGKREKVCGIQHEEGRGGPAAFSRVYAFSLTCSICSPGLCATKGRCGCGSTQTQKLPQNIMTFFVKYFL